MKIGGIRDYLNVIYTLKSSMEKNNELYYQGIEDLLLQEGIFCDTEVNENEKCCLQKIFKSVHFQYEMKQCYANSQRLLSSIHSESDIEYVEGYAVSEDLGIPLPHGWLLVNGKVLDVTWYRETFGICENNKTIYYGIKIHKSDILTAARETAMWQSHLDNYWAKHQILRSKFTHNKPYL